MSDSVMPILLEALDDLKARDVQEVDVRGKSDVMDTMLIASGTSNRHVKSLAGNAVEDAKAAGFQPLGVEGLESGEWVLVDFGDIVLHVMMPETREFYDLEKLWSVEPASRSKD
ncbi:ribosome silencing factor [Gilvimarinus xylanilyticus]|uniref:Ribosomal silencing factor RsfS n=1 Tax=Gilvimarinus xylanilyticus TaxID=2944139 RepID=A0A9X2I3N1_9GAMM|nr:ribosome silencing factor [Gilvimarinus xylanilyticus]MCP8899406.1 ribosome silencing factor [Gilvimarinus xylanilyticus]